MSFFEEYYIFLVYLQVYRICTEWNGCEKSRIGGHLERLSKSMKTRVRKFGMKGAE